MLGVDALLPAAEAGLAAPVFQPVENVFHGRFQPLPVARSASLPTLMRCKRHFAGMAVEGLAPPPKPNRSRVMSGQDIDQKAGNGGHQTIAQLLQQGLFHHRQGEIPVAMERYAEVLSKDPKNAEALYYVAVIACQEGQFKQGIDLARRAISLGGPSARLHNLLGQALERQDERLEAAKNFDKAIELDPNLAVAHGNRANILIDAGLPQEALKSLDRAIELDPKSVPDLINRGALLLTLGRPVDALASFDSALTVLPGNPSVLNNKGMALAALDRHEEALAAFDAAIAANPRAAETHRARARVLELLGRPDDARAALARADELQPPAGTPAP